MKLIKRPFFLGITGGVGAGKSLFLKALAEDYGATVIEADRLAEELCLPGHDCYDKIREAFPVDSLYHPDGTMDRTAFATEIFVDESKRKSLNRIVHPAVKRYIISMLAKLRSEEADVLLVLEAALLLEDGYDAICDEIWYVYADPEARRERLRRTRGYSDEKIDAILASQQNDAVFRSRCAAVLSNNGTKEAALSALKDCVRERIYERDAE